MKFEIRKPSLKKRIAQRTSLKKDKLIIEQN